ncbi:MAG TPA: tat pathway signal sequence [Pseudonocardiaceae bacterium]
MLRRLRLAVSPVLACAALTVVGCGPPAAGPPAAPKALARPAVTAPSATADAAPPPAEPPPTPRPTPPASCPGDSGWSCTQQQRFAAAGDYISRNVSGKGYLSVVFTDRQTGTVWRSGPTQHDGWTASTIKLAIATDLLRRQRARQLMLTAADRRDMDTMLNFSDEAASDRLWAKYGGEDMLARFRNSYGMTGLHFVPGFTAKTYWGFVKCTTDDLAALMNYVFTQVAPADRTYLVGALRGVAPNQRWGVWAAGPDQRPGNKDGWSFESDPYGKHWVTNTVGFAGPGERYLIAVMYQLDPRGTLSDGVHTVSDVVALLFGEPVPARITVPAPDG